MKNTSLITITTLRKTFVFSLGPASRSVLGILAFVLLVSVATGAVMMYEFGKEINRLSARKISLDNRIVSLNATVEELQDKINTQRYAFEKLNELEALTDMSFLDSDVSIDQTMLKPSTKTDTAEAFQEKKVLKQIHQIKLSLTERKWLLNAVPNGQPMAGRLRTTSSYGKRIHPVTGKRQFHYGIDFAARIGTPVVTTADGVIKYSGYNRHGFGKVVIIVHNYGFVTKYAHLDKLLVRKGEFVAKGQVVGEAGNTGISTGVHLHYEVEYLDSNLNPKPFIDWGSSNYKEIFSKEKAIKWATLINLLQTQIQTRSQPQLLPAAAFSKEN